MDIKDKIKFYLGEAIPAIAGSTNPAMAGARPLSTDATENSFIMKNKPLIKKLLLALGWNNNRLAASDVKKYLGNNENLYTQVMSFGWLQKTKHPGEFYELTPKGVNKIGGIE